MLGPVSVLQFKRNQSRQERCRVELTDNSLNVGEAACEWVEGNDVTVTN
jgi:hypothetical protein